MRHILLVITCLLPITCVAQNVVQMAIDLCDNAMGPSPNLSNVRQTADMLCKGGECVYRVAVPTDSMMSESLDTVAAEAYIAYAEEKEALLHCTTDICELVSSAYSTLPPRPNRE